MIIIDKITTATVTSNNTLTFNHWVNSSDEVVVINVQVFLTSGASDTFSTITVTYNGVNLPINKIQIPAIVNANVGVGSGAFVLFNPPVGSSSISVTTNVAGTGPAWTTYAEALTLLGVDKKTNNPIFQTTSGSSTSINNPNPTILTFQVPSPNSLIIDSFSGQLGGHTSPFSNFDSSQTLFFKNTGVAASYKYVTSSINLQSVTTTQNIQNAYAYVGILLEPAEAPSIWQPNVKSRYKDDIVKKNNWNTTVNTPLPGFTQSYPSQFFQNSFLHTVGRMIGKGGISLATRANETERPTSKIIIDKVYQGQLAAQALSTVTLSMQVNIPSQGADLIVTGGSVIATGAPFAVMTLNGTSLTKLVQTGVANQSAEIWWMRTPGVGTKTLTITSGTGGEIYANAMVVLGLDNRDINLITASATDAASTAIISNTLTPDAPNCLIIDCIAALDATANPVPDQLQTQVFNGSALASSEAVLSTYKIGGVTPQTMSYNLSVAVNASMVSAAFRPAQATSQWFPNITTRTIDDTVTTNGLDVGTNPAFGNYGYKPTTFWQNSFLHTVGRMNRNIPVSAAQYFSFLPMTGVG